MNPFDGSGLVLAVFPLLGRTSHPIAARRDSKRIRNTYHLGELRSYDDGETYAREGIMEFNDSITGPHHVREVYVYCCINLSFEHRQEIDGILTYINIMPVASLDQGKIFDWDKYLSKAPVRTRRDGDLIISFKEVHFWIPLYSCVLINVDKPARGHIIVGITTQRIQNSAEIVNHNITVECTEKGIYGDSFSTGHLIYSRETIHEI